jgi:hypothetical protein
MHIFQIIANSLAACFLLWLVVFLYMVWKNSEDNK